MTPIPAAESPRFAVKRNENTSLQKEKRLNSSAMPTGTFKAVKYKTGLPHLAFHKLPSGYSDVRRIPHLLRTQK